MTMTKTSDVVADKLVGKARRIPRTFAMTDTQVGRAGSTFLT